VYPAFGIKIGPALTCGRIKRLVAGFYGIHEMHMTSAQRDKSVARPRQVAMYLAHELTGHSYSNIGRLFGKRDHTTVMHACKRIPELMEDNDCFAAQVEFLRERLAA
jgi:chromosomal replication initiator protein